MKVQERTGAGNHRVPSPAQSAGERLPTVARERKPALAALAVLLILVGALGATVLVLRAGNRVEVAKLTHNVEAGQAITSSDVTSVMVANDNSINYIKWDQLGTVEKTLTARSALYSGSLLVGEMFTGEKGTPAGKAVVGLSLKDGQYPVGIKAGDTVTVYRVGDRSGSSSSSSSGSQSGSSSNSGSSGGGIIVNRATVSQADKPNDSTISSGNLAVTLLVDNADAAALSQAASAGEAAVVTVASH
ncbi:hypothetical protein ACIPW9_31730 [Streptomyces sp. NPDC090052]|uniref:hypothetical protein n=1 Tax=unclassified Streptomyces TaxID=2593676 RepID=UPI002E23D5F8|nr:hypothetical protein OG372_21185 [Streptomyces sp. NBC_01020]WSX43969.1 hypothetical protein OG760_21070 [Streptomyces sp. NBC_00963]